MEIDDPFLFLRKRAFVFLLVLSVSVAAICSIMLVLGKYDDYRYFPQVFVTSLTIVATSIAGWICDQLLEREGAQKPQNLPLTIVPQMGLVFNMTWTALCLAIIWGPGTIATEMYLRVLATTGMLSWGFSHISLLSLARLNQAYSWARVAAVLAIVGLSGIFFTQIWTPYGYDELTGKITCILIILTVACSILVAVFHVLSQSGKDNDVA